MEQTVAAFVERVETVGADAEACACLHFTEVTGSGDAVAVLESLAVNNLGSALVAAGLLHPAALLSLEVADAARHTLVIAAALGYALGSAGQDALAQIQELSADDWGSIADQWGKVGE